MQFVFPLFLVAAAAIAVPVIIHLFYFRRYKKVYFTNVRFLQEVKDITSNRQRLRNLLVLLMRCLALIFLVLAFAVLIPPALLSPSHRVSMLWLLSCMTLLVVGELLIGPLGLSLLVRLAPPRFVGVVMGIWYVAGAVGCWLAGEVGALWMK